MAATLQQIVQYDENVACRKILPCTYVVDIKNSGLKIRCAWENKLSKTEGSQGIEWETETITGLRKEDCSGIVMVVV